MMDQIMSWFPEVFAACSTWFRYLLAAVGGTGVVLAAFIVYIVINLLVTPLRGGRSIASDYLKNPTYKFKKTKPKSKPNNSQKKANGHNKE